MVRMATAILGSGNAPPAMPSPSGSSAWFAWALVIVCGVLATVCGVMWRTTRADLLAEREESKAARAETRALNDALLKDIVPTLTRANDVTQRATEALLTQGHR